MVYKFEIGQKVRCYRPPENYETGESTRGGSGWYRDRVFTIKKITEVHHTFNHGHDIQVLWPEPQDGYPSGSGAYNLWCEPLVHVPEDLFKIS